MTVRVVAYLLILLCFAGSASAQPVETLVGEEQSYGGFGGPLLGFTQLSGEAAFLMGGAGAWILNRRLFFGGAGESLVSTVRVDGRRLSFNYGGVWMGSIFRPHALIHGGIALLLGGGDASLQGGGRAGFFLVEPQAFGELNVSSFFRITLGVSYRWLTGLELDGMTEGDLRGMAVQLGFKFGKY